MQTSDYAVVGLLALVVAGSQAALGLLLLRTVRHRSLSTLVTASVLVSLGPIVAGMVGTAAAMYVIDQNLTVALLVSVICAATGAAVALLLGRRLVGAATTLRDTSSHIGRPDYTAVSWLPTVELRELADALDRSHRRLVHAREREQALEASRRELVAWVSHDLRTPLAALTLMTEAMLDGVAVDPARYLQQIRDQVGRLDRLVDDLFLLSRMHAGTLRLDVVAVPVEELVSDVRAGLDPVAYAGGVRLEVGGQPSTTVSVDAPYITRALTNLVHNAVRASPDGGRVRIETAVHGDELQVSVADSCGGLAEEDVPRLFDLGWRAAAARSSEGGGLGLAVALGIVQAHRGRIEVGNHADGCRFTVVLPVGGAGPPT